ALVFRVEVVARGQDLAYLFDSLVVPRDAQRLKDHVVQIFRVPELFGRGMGYEGRVFVGRIIVRETHLLGQHAYDFECQSVDAYARADGGRIAEELARDLGAEKDDAAFFFHVLIIDEASEFGDLAAHQRVFRGDAAHGARGLLHVVGQRQVSDVFRAGV